MTVAEPLRERLVSAGVDMLEQVGAVQLGLRAIAREAGVSHGAPRRYFPTHNSLLAAVAARGYADLRTEIEAVQGDSPRQRLEAACRTYIGFATRRPEMFTLMFRHDLLEGAGENLRETVTLPLFRWWRDLVAACAPDAPDDRAIALWTNLHGIAVVAANRSLEAVAPQADVDRLIEIAITRHLG
ncbi:TetR/AcrR family transcriptional regulator [Nocardia huaxiensis]|uniref:TetR/AcrR family transcriptional regulator n=2 Tax=Nocardia huaxiensis TaxID=2755382 RepID=A0A7D6VP01_9NOCA|nr:TetR/AcrR family transcriptional regulator [Nocardia huaxiensis]QLY34256.1 TetR/AcrR family transcriptional regulator [Nocardia huaxiensis]UFT00110.1 TetR/AcrR family transcriptional regulator [Nocardia huaxiensis]